MSLCVAVCLPAVLTTSLFAGNVTSGTFTCCSSTPFLSLQLGVHGVVCFLQGGLLLTNRRDRSQSGSLAISLSNVTPH